ncbi:DUF7638 domain-containing protein [Actinoplanes derwentensis]|uniref:DUF7638 domain-containing protein n=1 Tax=Actinoplanes derwentensis TaxID=113562 RepID=A0A1H1QXQ5_9ACTN|nr:hypothetical protein [Actinoplanes derwentensis]GID87093.1 hypothetical protein Ade03nite_60170 [Actinoplanes derwentensis]SDS28146.1 hypothetical protein SAMN04489716_0433 [Actinoplanes derwentensis]
MPDSTPTWREVDGDVVHGRQRQIFTRSYDGAYRLEPLACFADGLISHGGDLTGLRAALADGRLTLSPPEGTEVWVPGVGVIVSGPADRAWTAGMMLEDLTDGTVAGGGSLGTRRG